MDKDTFKILDFLSNHVYGSIVDISDYINKIFPYKRGISKDDFDVEKRLLNRFLDGLETTQYVNLNGCRNEIGEYYLDRKNWVENRHRCMVLITIIGLQVINQEKFNRSIKRYNRGQIIALICTIFISTASVIIAWMAYNAANDKFSQKQYLLPSKELIELIKRK
jgi:hypothetical protein